MAAIRNKHRDKIAKAARRLAEAILGAGGGESSFRRSFIVEAFVAINGKSQRFAVGVSNVSTKSEAADAVKQHFPHQLFVDRIYPCDEVSDVLREKKADGFLMAEDLPEAKFFRVRFADSGLLVWVAADCRESAALVAEALHLPHGSGKVTVL